FLPGFLKDGWHRNLLADYDLTPARDLYKAGQFAAARDRFSQSEQLYRDLGRTARAHDIAADRDHADQDQGAADLTPQARRPRTGRRGRPIRVGAPRARSSRATWPPSPPRRRPAPTRRARESPRWPNCSRRMRPAPGSTWAGRRRRPARREPPSPRWATRRA